MPRSWPRCWRWQARSPSSRGTSGKCSRTLRSQLACGRSSAASSMTCMPRLPPTTSIRPRGESPPRTSAASRRRSGRRCLLTCGGTAQGPVRPAVWTACKAASHRPRAKVLQAPHRRVSAPAPSPTPERVLRRCRNRGRFLHQSWSKGPGYGPHRHRKPDSSSTPQLRPHAVHATVPQPRPGAVHATRGVSPAGPLRPHGRPSASPLPRGPHPPKTA
mmetsp:Transcript_16787/g.30020  ORF Transcript_16787/g.30020 Transcript_16787/m.30020 type:complete len:217 (-) Transcript_16787:105-755(-)